jgi:hypothetical protein
MDELVQVGAFGGGKPHGAPSTSPNSRSTVPASLATVTNSDVGDRALAGEPIALFPAINADRFGGSPHTFGPTQHGNRGRRAARLGAVRPGQARRPLRLGLADHRLALGAVLAGFGAVPGLPASLALLATAGAGAVLSVVFRTTIIPARHTRRDAGRNRSTESMCS